MSQGLHIDPVMRSKSTLNPCTSVGFLQGSGKQHDNIHDKIGKTRTRLHRPQRHIKREIIPRTDSVSIAYLLHLDLEAWIRRQPTSSPQRPCIDFLAVGEPKMKTFATTWGRLSLKSVIRMEEDREATDRAMLHSPLFVLVNIYISPIQTVKP